MPIIKTVQTIEELDAGMARKIATLAERVAAAHAGDIRLQTIREPLITIDDSQSWAILRQRAIVRERQDVMCRMRDRVEAERMAYVHDWDADRFPLSVR